MFLGLSTDGASLWQLPFVTAILFQAQEYAMRAFNIAQEKQLGAHEQNLIEQLLSIISTEETYPIP